MKIDGLEIPSDDWLEGFCTAMQVAHDLINEKCYPTLVGEALLNTARDVKRDWEEQNGKVAWKI